MIQQFKQYLDNQMTNEFIPEEDRVEFTEVKEVYKEGIFVVAETNAGTYVYEPQPYMVYADTGNTEYDFIFETKKATA